ncbi:hypothetical protein O9X90_09505 [Agrobacterium leguminum]|uniref:hypothetical protein n=1 Tax=Agrobacterium leguminum TaxID=2792015 RepID=UPI0022B83945|nr:hypothetical protein [Agrobacterium leguminum]MCZ7932546.1 hypothetical protein [Agrobacterium leguminum]
MWQLLDLDLQYSLQFCGVYKERFFLLQGAREGEAQQKSARNPCLCRSIAITACGRGKTRLVCDTALSVGIAVGEPVRLAFNGIGVG